jgi:hypothetical protein
VVKTESVPCSTEKGVVPIDHLRWISSPPLCTSTLTIRQSAIVTRKTKKLLLLSNPNPAVHAQPSFQGILDRLAAAQDKRVITSSSPSVDHTRLFPRPPLRVEQQLYVHDYKQ